MDDLDTKLFKIINSSGNSYIDYLMLWMSSDTLWVVFYLMLLTYFIVTKKTKWSLQLLMVLIPIFCADTICFRFMKTFFLRYRPCYELSDLRLVYEACGGYLGFPSNHAANSMCVAFCFLGGSSRHLPLILLFFAIVIGFSRIYLGVHYPTDVLMGYLVGGTVGGIYAFVLQRLRQGKKYSYL